MCRNVCEDDSVSVAPWELPTNSSAALIRPCVWSQLGAFRPSFRYPFRLLLYCGAYTPLIWRLHSTVHLLCPQKKKTQWSVKPLGMAVFELAVDFSISSGWLFNSWAGFTCVGRLLCEVTHSGHNGSLGAWFAYVLKC